MHISPAAPSHFPDILGLVFACRDALLAEGIHQWDGQYPEPFSIRRDLELGQCFVAQLEGRIVGAVTLNQAQEPEYDGMPWRWPPPCLVIHRLCVSPAHQGHGIGSALMAFAERCAAEAGMGSLRLDVYSGNPRAAGLYEHLGFSAVGEFSYPSREWPFRCMEKRVGQGATAPG